MALGLGQHLPEVRSCEFPETLKRGTTAETGKGEENKQVGAEGEPGFNERSLCANQVLILVVRGRGGGGRARGVGLVT